MLGDIGSIIQAAATVLGLLLGAAWTRYLFKNRRGKFSWANVTHQITAMRIDGDKHLIRIVVSIANVGNVLLSVEHLEIRVNQMLPLEEDLLASVNADSGIDDFNLTTTEWPTLVIRDRNWDPGKFEIEPNESDEINFDFIISSDVRTIEIYTYFQNTNKHPGDIGWSHTSLHEFGEPEFVD